MLNLVLMCLIYYSYVNLSLRLSRLAFEIKKQSLFHMCGSQILIYE